MKRLKNAEAHNVIVLYCTCWLFYNAYLVWEDKIKKMMQYGLPYSLPYHIMMMNPFIYMVDLPKAFDHDSIDSQNILIHSCLQIIIGLVCFIIVVLWSEIEIRRKFKPKN